MIWHHTDCEFDMFCLRSWFHCCCVMLRKQVKHVVMKQWLMLCSSRPKWKCFFPCQRFVLESQRQRTVPHRPSLSTARIQFHRKMCVLCLIKCLSTCFCVCEGTPNMLTSLKRFHLVSIITVTACLVNFTERNRKKNKDKWPATGFQGA